MNPPRILIVSGSPGSGKSTLARNIATKHKLILLQRDDLKERMFDTLGWSDRDWSQKVGVASYKLLYHVLEAILAAGHSCIIESNFVKKYDEPTFAAMQQRYNAQIIEVLCTCATAVAFARFKQRAESGERHPGHVDTTHLENVQKGMETWDYPGLGLSPHLITVDTTDFESEEYTGVFGRIEKILAS